MSTKRDKGNGRGMGEPMAAEDAQRVARAALAELAHLEMDIRDSFREAGTPLEDFPSLLQILSRMHAIATGVIKTNEPISPEDLEFLLGVREVIAMSLADTSVLD